MVTRLFPLAAIILQLQLAANSPLRQQRSPRELQPQQLLISSHPALQHYPRSRGNIQLLAPIPLSQLYIHQKLHVIPASSNLVHGTVQHIVTKDNIKIPVLAQNVQQNGGNYSHARPTLLPLLIPIHNIVSTGNHLIPVHDLSVIPLQRTQLEKAQYRSMQQKEEDDEHTGQYRNFFGGYGNGLFFGGHGSGHGFYAYGK